MIERHELREYIARKHYSLWKSRVDIDDELFLLWEELEPGARSTYYIRADEMIDIFDLIWEHDEKLGKRVVGQWEEM